MGSFFGDLWDDFTDIPEDIIDHFKSLAEGPGGVVGILVTAGGTVLLGNPSAIIEGVVAAEITDAVTKTRRMSPKERTLAHMVYGDSLPLDKIILTDVEGKDGRWFTIPNAIGEFLVNIGGAYNDPIRHTNNNYPELGQLLIHELAHAWQIDHTGSIDYIMEAVPPQITGPEYNPGDGSKPWNEYSIEQQATIVDIWYSGVNVYAGVNLVAPCSKHVNYYDHILNTINAGNEPPAVQTLSFRNVASSKFGEENGFSVRLRFSPFRTGSLRKALIGLD